MTHAYIVEDFGAGATVVAHSLDDAKAVLVERYGPLGWDTVEAHDGRWYAEPIIGRISRVGVVG